MEQEQAIKHSVEKDIMEVLEVEDSPISSGEEEESDLIGSEWEWEHRPHPMCIPHIVDNILCNLNQSDLKSCRLVNSQYNEISCYNLAKKEVITFNKMAHITSYLRWMPISSLQKQPLRNEGSSCCSSDEESNNEHEYNRNSLKSHLHKREDEFAKDEGSHFAKNYAHTSFHFNFDPDCLVGSDTENVKILEEFYTTIGPHVKSLRFTTDLIPFNFPKRLPHIGDIWGNRLENLESLSFEMKWGIPPVLFETGEGRVILPSLKRLNVDILVTEREADRAAIFLRQLLLAAPNLQEISIPGNKKFFDDYINVLLGRIILAVPLPRLTTLDFCLALSETQIRGLAERKFPLKSLILDFADVQQFSFLAPVPQPPGPAQQIQGINGVDDENNNHNHPQNHFVLQSQLLNRSLYNLFLQIAPTLKKLHLCFPYSPSHPLHRFTFPVPMDSLNHLALGGFYGSVKILDHLPAIKKLELWNVRFHDFDCGSDNDNPCEGSDGEKAKQFVPHQYLGITTVIS